MKIGIYDPYLDDLGGGEKYMMTIAQCLSKKHEVSIFWDSQDELRPLLQRFSIDLSSVKIKKNIFNKKTSLIKRLWETKKYDLIIVLSDGSIPLVWSRLFLHFQQPIVDVNYSPKDLLKISRLTKVFCNSSFTQSFLDRHLKEKSIVIYPPITFKSKKIGKENIILNVGRFRVRNVGIADYKKQSVLVDVFMKKVDKGLKKWRFVLATSLKPNEEEEFEKLRNKAKGYPIEFLVNKTNDDLWDTYSKSKIYWHAAGFGEDLEKHPDFAEHFGISTVEAMGAGAVPIVFGAGGQKEIVEDGESGFLWQTLSELENKTLKLISDQDLWFKISEKAEKRAKYFSDQNFCKQIQDLIEV